MRTSPTCSKCGYLQGAILKRWWAFMSCAVFTFIGLYSAYAGKSSHWVAVASSFAAIALFLVASYGAWHQEHKRAEDAIAENKKQLSEAQAESQPKPNLQQAWNELASKFESLASNSVTKHVRADWIYAW